MKRTGYILGKIGSTITLSSALLMLNFFLILFLITLAAGTSQDLNIYHLPFTTTFTIVLGAMGLTGAKIAKKGNKKGYYFMLVSGILVSVGTIIQVAPPRMLSTIGLNELLPAAGLTFSIFYIDPQITILGAVLGLMSFEKQFITKDDKVEIDDSSDSSVEATEIEDEDDDFII